MEPGKSLQRCCKLSPKKQQKFPEESFFKELSNHLFFSQKSSTDRVTAAPGQKAESARHQKTASGIRLLSPPKLKKPPNHIMEPRKSLQRCCKRQKKKKKNSRRTFLQRALKSFVLLPEIFHRSSNNGSRAESREREAPGVITYSLGLEGKERSSNSGSRAESSEREAPGVIVYISGIGGEEKGDIGEKDIGYCGKDIGSHSVEDSDVVEGGPI
ncbi:hypothetical protein CDAR_91101 [Caerostris darwini]|uniref:Uncharacterized protein n=1 Tax=Caerostris darwini TaxID=1538125 RepID=A0AAV4Q8K8_9ARAC|nr:hypothetical protein CDAR_91101 [Caerostris darwini]